MKTGAVFAIPFLLIPHHAAAQRTKTPAEATVFIRLIANVHADIEEAGLKQSADFDNVEVATGSGFVISPYGHVLTNYHVISQQPMVRTTASRQIKLTFVVSKIEVCLQPGVATMRGVISPCSEASVIASDPALDLAALLPLGASNVPYLPLGDSDAVKTGLPVDALGYPFGRELELGKIAVTRDLVPEVSVTSGTISAMRAGDGGERRYLQITNSLNPGNSGGPLVDRDGYAVGVIRLKVSTAAEIGFAIPINEVKDFLESHGLDQAMPVRRLRLGPFEDFGAKGLRLRLTEAAVDTSPFRSHVETDAQSDITLRVDRVLSPWTAKQIEQTLLGTQAFERVSIVDHQSAVSTAIGNTPALVGRATGTAGNQDIGMDYAILDLGAEKLVARYVGTTERMAFNASVLRQSLATLEGRRLVVDGPVETAAIEWAATGGASDKDIVPIPRGWLIEPNGPIACQGLGSPSAEASASPTQDFTVTLRAGVWRGGDVNPDATALACSARRGSLGPASYASGADWLGVSYLIEGVFIRTSPEQVLQLEVRSPIQRAAFSRSLLAAWIKRVTQ